jgi:hypothetical protein
MITPRDSAVLASIVHYFTLTRVQISRMHFPDDSDGRTTRKRLQLLLDAKLINRTHMQVVNPAMGAPAPVYYPSAAGCAFLAQEREDPRYLLTCTSTPTWQNLYHWVQVADVHIMLDHAVARSPGVTVDEWLSEWSIANPEETEPSKRFRLHTLLREHPRLVCVPDAAFLLQKDGHRKVFYLEVDRDTTQPAHRVIARKAEGYAQLALQGRHRRHFPMATVDNFILLMIAPTAKRRDALRHAMTNKNGSVFWKFASLTDLSADRMLTAPVFYPCVGDPLSILKGGAA